MRAFLASAVAVACSGAAVLVLPPSSSAGATSLTSAYAPAAVPGSTRTVPLTPLGPAGRALGPVPRGVTARAVAPFSMLGITWDDPAAEPRGTIQVRTRSTSSGTWSPWRTLEREADLPDLDSPDRATGRTRGGTAPLWVGTSDGVQVRVTPDGGAAVDGRRAAVAPLPRGMRLDMVDPGRTSPAMRAALAPSGHGGRHRPGHHGRHHHVRYYGAHTGRHFGLRPRIITRSGWGADESLRESDAPPYATGVKAVIVHHTDSANDYECADAPGIIRAIYRYHVRSEGWRDIGYNFLVDKCGRIYEGRAGGVERAVVGAHTLGFNTGTTGIGVIGEFTHQGPPRAALHAIERLAAWKLSLDGVDADSTTTLVSGGSNKYRKGVRIRFHVIAGHRDGFLTDCPGDRLYAELPEIRRATAGLQRTGRLEDGDLPPYDEPSQGDTAPQYGDRPGDWGDGSGQSVPGGDDVSDLVQEFMG